MGRGCGALAVGGFCVTAFNVSNIHSDVVLSGVCGEDLNDHLLNPSAFGDRPSQRANAFPVDCSLRVEILAMTAGAER